MNEKLKRYLTVSYQKDVLGTWVDVEAVLEQYQADPDFVSAAAQYRGRLEALASKFDLAKRDFAGYQALKALRKVKDAVIPRG